MRDLKWFLVRLTTWGFVPVTLIFLAATLGVMMATTLATAMAKGSLLVNVLPGVGSIPSLLLAVFASELFMAWGKWMRERFVREAPLPTYPKRKLREAYPDLSGKDCDLAERALRQFFLASVRSGKSRLVAMPSKLAERLWREFANHADVYQHWCKTAFGRVLEPTSAQCLGSSADANDALRRTWFWACKEEAINPKNPTRLPLLFALDAKLLTAGGIVYATNSAAIAWVKKPDEQGDAGAVYFGTGFSDGCYSGDCENFGGADSSSDSDSGGGSDGGGD